MPELRINALLNHYDFQLQSNSNSEYQEYRFKADDYEVVLELDLVDSEYNLYQLYRGNPVDFSIAPETHMLITIVLFKLGFLNNIHKELLYQLKDEVEAVIL